MSGIPEGTAEWRIAYRLEGTNELVWVTIPVRDGVPLPVTERMVEVVIQTTRTHPEQKEVDR